MAVLAILLVVTAIVTVAVTLSRRAALIGSLAEAGFERAPVVEVPSVLRGVPVVASWVGERGGWKVTTGAATIVHPPHHAQTFHFVTVELGERVAAAATVAGSDPRRWDRTVTDWFWPEDVATRGTWYLGGTPHAARALASALAAVDGADPLRLDGAALAVERSGARLYVARPGPLLDPLRLVDRALLFTGALGLRPGAPAS